MKTYTKTVREGEYLGPVDWDYDFLSHGYSKERTDRFIDMLSKVAKSPEKYMATTDGGWPRVGWGKVLQVGMYDGWPYWRPVPSVCIMGTLGPSWNSFTSITSIREIENKQPETA